MSIASAAGAGESGADECGLLSALRSMAGVVGAEPLDGDLVDEVCRIESSIRAVSGGMEVENCRGVLKYTDDTVELDMGRQRLCVRGEGLALAELSGRNLFVKGQVFSIELKNSDGKGGGWRDAGMAAGQGAVSGGRRRR